MKSARLRSRGFTLIASLLMLLLLSGISIGLMMMVNTEGKVGGVDLQNNVAYHNAEGAIEKMTSDLSATFKSVQAPKASDICALSSYAPSVPGVTWKDYQVQPASGCSATLANNYGQISTGPNQGLWAQIIPVTMLATAAQSGGQEVSMMRTAQVALIPVFQFGVFCDNDCSFFSGPNFDFAGRAHTNGDLYPSVGNGSTLTFHDKVTVYGNVVRTQLANGFPTASNYAGTVLIPTASGGCDTGLPACRALALTEGSVTGAGGNPPQSGTNPGWPNISVSTYHSEVANGNFGILPPGGTGAKKLSLPFVNGSTHPYEIIRRARATDSSGLSDSREFNMAQIRVLLSDNPAELPGGAGDNENVRLANVPTARYPNGIPTSYPAGLPAVAGAQTYNTYFAAGSNAIPDATTCTAASAAGPTCPPLATSAPATTLLFDWPYAPANAPAGAQTLVPFPAPVNTFVGAPAPSVNLCPPGNLNTGLTPPAGCPTTNPPYPYEVTLNLDKAATWNLIDGYLRVEYKDVNGVWHPVTGEWLGLGFARGVVPPTNVPGNAGSNPVNPNAILILQEPADRNADGVLDQDGLAPVCLTFTSVATGSKCKTWNYGRPPEVIKDPASGNPYVELSNNNINSGITRNNWYPINIYDAREGEARDVANNTSVAPVGVVNAVEIDVGNLKRWLWGQIGVNGPNVDFKTQNGWVLYFSDRRGMLLNPNAPYNGAEKSGDSGLEDSINSGSSAGVPDGALEPIPAGKSFSPEDVNQNLALDSFGEKNIGLGFYNGAVNVNGQIQGDNDVYIHRVSNPVGLPAGAPIVARKNWVSGARHGLRLVDAGFGNVPYRLDGTLLSPGGFTVASENPVYIQGDYNSNSADPIWNPGGVDQPGHAAASVIADSVTLLSNSWSDVNSFLNPTNMTNRNATNTYYRLAIAGGKNMSFPKPTYGNQDYGTDGGVHNFLRYLEDWSGQTLYYKGSLVSLYYSTYNTGVFKCCTSVYGAPTRRYSFDADFALPGGLPPGTPLFRDVDTLGYRQVFAVRSY